MTLPDLWFLLIALFFTGYFVLDGFDFGVGMSLPFLGRDDTDRRVLINTIGPVWDLNETWVIVAGASLFAAFPEWYATVFSGFYLPMLFILLALILRGVSFEYRHQRPDHRWKRNFDTMIFVGSVVPAFLWGFVFANIVRGMPLDAHFDYIGSFGDLWNAFSILGGLATLMLFFTHGLVFVSLKTDGEIRVRARKLAVRAGVATVVVAGAFLVATLVAHGNTLSLILTLATVVALVVAFVANLRGREGVAFAFMAVTIALTVATLFATLFPNTLVATNDPANTMTIANSASAHYTLELMSWISLVFVPLILAYQGFTYWIFRKRVTRAHIAAAAH
ncbi:cytochrome d ubiquinol oxidase subunit II [Frondihabitans australicus]|uniref:Cytochrome bd-I ubiquinol oxidase subunit 2 apoprotein n=1 Tax=Frondihabitans australicus TaxID=386892 RepID=A0A495IFN5_9MICO|nr:cytochrome d ubiquinol oxidase subunit II [Frondihabitans australicus]RKR73876.1 cytochrome bd-I ubiquinol oxidase subunit 2 apoprotein [Frondihabitans australicus]